MIPYSLIVTARELAVILAMTERGATAATAARKLGMTEGTLRTHLRNVYADLNVHSIGQAYRACREMGLL